MYRNFNLLFTVFIFFILTSIHHQSLAEDKVAILSFVDNNHSHWSYIQRDINMMDSLSISYDLIKPQDLTSQNLSKYKLLIIPTVWAEHSWQTAERNASIVDFIYNGGGLLVTEAGFSGSHTPSFFPYSITISAGWAVQGNIGITDSSSFIVNNLAVHDFYTGVDSRITSKDLNWHQIVLVNGEDAIVYCKHGSGFAIYSGYQIFQTGIPESNWYVNVVFKVLNISSKYIYGTVRDNWGNPLSDVNFKIYAKRFENVMSYDTTTSASSSDLEGKFFLQSFDYEDSVYVIVAFKSGYTEDQIKFINTFEDSIFVGKLILYPGEKFTDDHIGWTGAQDYDNTYEISISGYNIGNKYELISNGYYWGDTNGNIKIKKEGLDWSIIGSWKVSTLSNLNAEYIKKYNLTEFIDGDGKYEIIWDYQSGLTGINIFRATVNSYFGLNNKVAILTFIDNNHSHWSYIQRDIDMMDSLSISYDLIKPQDLTSQNLSKYKLLIIPTVWAEHSWQTTERNASIVDFIYNGGGLLVTEAGFSGAHTPSFFPYSITINAGWAVQGNIGITDSSSFIVNNLAVHDFYTGVDSRITSKDLNWHQIVSVNGEDAIVYCKHGSGFAIYSGYQIFQTGIPESNWYVNIVYMALGTITSVREFRTKTLPNDYHLYQNYPNPFNPSTNIEYRIPKRGIVDINIFNLNGQVVRKYIKEYQKAGIYKTIWDGTNSHGNTVASGIYIYQIKFNNSTRSKRMIFLR